MTQVAAAWAREQLGVAEITSVRVRPWSAVWRVDTASGRWWLKENRAGTAYEPRLLTLLAGTGSDLLPPVRVHPTRPWSLLGDAGESVGELAQAASTETLVTFWCGLLARYGELQRQVAVADLHAAGVPDLGASRLTATYTRLLVQPGWLAPARTRDLSGAQQAAVRRCGPRLDDAARQLAAARASTVQHDDLQGGNVLAAGLADSAGARVVDWGDASISHPFATLLVCLDLLGADRGLGRDAPPLRRVRDAYLEGWRVGGESSSSLLDELDLVLRVAPLVRAASCARALGAPADQAPYDGWVARWLLRLAQGLGLTA